VIIDIFDIHLTGVAGAVAGALAYWGCLGIAFDVSGWVSDRFEWDRPSWRPWTWRMYRRWFGPGQLVASEDFDEDRVLDIDFWPSRDRLDTWVQVQPYRERADMEDRPAWLPLAELMPAAVGRFADDDTETTRDDVVPTA